MGDPARLLRPDSEGLRGRWTAPLAKGQTERRAQRPCISERPCTRRPRTPWSSRWRGGVKPQEESGVVKLIRRWTDSDAQETATRN